MAEALCWRVLARNLEHRLADVHAARPEIGPHRAPAASTDVEAISEAVVTMAEVVVTAVVMAMSKAMPTTMHAVTAAMSAAAMTATSRSRGDGSSGQSECGNGRERDLTKHILHSPCKA